MKPIDRRKLERCLDALTDGRANGLRFTLTYRMRLIALCRVILDPRLARYDEVTELTRCGYLDPVNGPTPFGRQCLADLIWRVDRLAK